MSIAGGCDCNNIEVIWHVVDYSLVPRACQCEYCLSKTVAYVTKSGTKFEILIRNETLHKEIQHGSNSAVFHECANCNQLVFVTSIIEGEVYGALNADRLNNKFGFSASVRANFSSQSAEEKLERWRQNWCHPILIKSLASKEG